MLNVPARAALSATLALQLGARRRDAADVSRVVQHGKAHCLEAVLAAATILEQQGHPPMVLDLESQDRLDHVLFLYRVRGLWGTIGRSRDIGLHGRKPVFRSISDLVWSYVDPYVDGKGRFAPLGTKRAGPTVRGSTVSRPQRRAGTDRRGT
ncbi:MAG: hypothetical protein FJX78_01905 [Armatimonadetes bacterium]|nr:hypothetical protein [Armatimonadota bacterium]